MTPEPINKPVPMTAEELIIFKAHCVHIGITNVITHADGTEITHQRILDTIDAQQAEIERLRGAINEVIDLYPGEQAKQMIRKYFDQALKGPADGK